MLWTIVRLHFRSISGIYSASDKRNDVDGGLLRQGKVMDTVEVVEDWDSISDPEPHLTLDQHFPTN